jgi:hypothetical protein
MKNTNCVWVAGLRQMVREKMAEGHLPFLVTFTFYQILGSNRHVANVMKNEIERLYHLITQRLIVRNDRSPSHEGRTGLFIAAPDWPVPKSNRQPMLSSRPNSGMHFHGFWLTPPLWMQRRKELLSDYWIENQGRFVRRPIFEVDIKEIVSDPEYVLEYILKAMTRNRATPDDLIILPRARNESRSNLKRGNSSIFSSDATAE